LFKEQIASGLHWTRGSRSFYILAATGTAPVSPIICQMKTFVFDADGVICVGESFSVALERKHEIPRERLASFFTEAFPGCVLGRRDLKEAIAPYAAEWGWRKSVEALLAFWFRSEHVISLEALECVRWLRKKGHVCVLGTNQDKYRTSYLRCEMRLAEEFDQIFASCELGVAKPSAAFFSSIQKHLEVPASSLCLIDDSESNVAAAKESGWRGVWYRGLNDVAAIKEEANLEGCIATERTG
jgi:putative hydrolase of the HAD superfamily